MIQSENFLHRNRWIGVLLARCVICAVGGAVWMGAMGGLLGAAVGSILGGRIDFGVGAAFGGIVGITGGSSVGAILFFIGALLGEPQEAARKMFWSIGNHAARWMTVGALVGGLALASLGIGVAILSHNSWQNAAFFAVFYGAPILMVIGEVAGAIKGMNQERKRRGI